MQNGVLEIATRHAAYSVYSCNVYCAECNSRYPLKPA